MALWRHLCQQFFLWQQAIILVEVDKLSSDNQTSVKFEYYCMHTLSRKYIWKRWLHNASHFGHASVYYDCVIEWLSNLAENIYHP